MDDLWAWIGTRTNWRPDTHQPDDDDDDDGDDDEDDDDDHEEDEEEDVFGPVEIFYFCSKLAATKIHSRWKNAVTGIFNPYNDW